MYGEKHCYQFLLKNDSSSKTAREISVNIDVFDLSGNAFTAAPVLVNLDGEHSKKINLHPGTEVLFTLIEFEKNSMGLCTLQLNSGDDKKSNGFLPIDEISEYRIALKATAENMPPVFCEHYIECSNEKRVKWQ
ncbi:MAG: hypothetical protein HN719_13330 [Alphaproteobacteria bacterium]|nr:hypothetical protein [Alphaproteobacteria bacterium]